LLILALRQTFVQKPARIAVRDFGWNLQKKALNYSPKEIGGQLNEIKQFAFP
jgi:hypothetical protein